MTSNVLWYNNSDEKIKLLNVCTIILFQVSIEVIASYIKFEKALVLPYLYVVFSEKLFWKIQKKKKENSKDVSIEYIGSASFFFNFILEFNEKSRNHKDVFPDGNTN